VNSSRRRANAAFVLVCTLGLALPASAQQTPPTPASPPSKSSPPVTNELDLFMDKVLKRRDVNRQTLEQYSDESSSSSIGPGCGLPADA
jgi:hypothetical protein